jgi:hypothetical protein
MECLAPPYEFVLNLIYDLESGGNVRSFVRKFTQNRQNEFCELLERWLISKQANPISVIELKFKTPYQKSIWDLLEIANQGGSILSALQALEKEIRFVCEEQLETHLGQLPYKMMVPLLFFQFPALLLLLLGPVVGQLMMEVSQ